jgi:hypothetical protein
VHGPRIQLPENVRVGAHQLTPQMPIRGACVEVTRRPDTFGTTTKQKMAQQRQCSTAHAICAHPVRRPLLRTHLCAAAKNCSLRAVNKRDPSALQGCAA